MSVTAVTDDCAEKDSGLDGGSRDDRGIPRLETKGGAPGAPTVIRSNVKRQARVLLTD